MSARTIKVRLTEAEFHGVAKAMAALDSEATDYEHNNIFTADWLGLHAAERAWEKIKGAWHAAARPRRAS